uniref:Uncharacterized protein n=1 Tax=Onchocerca volvulus TaxID=6282 RepID=A0A8R1XQ41_ONCVO
MNTEIIRLYYQISMDLKSFILFAFVVGHAISFNCTSTETSCNEYLCEIVTKAFIRTTAGKKIYQELSYEDLKNMKTVKVLAKAANFELNRRSQVLHYRDGKINPPFLRKDLELAFRVFSNNTTCLELNKFNQYHWSPYCVILFNSETPLDVTRVINGCKYCVILFNSETPLDVTRVINGSGEISSSSTRIKRNRMNGVILPEIWYRNGNFESLSLESIRSFLPYSMQVKSDAKLIIMIDGSGDEYRAFEAIDKIRWQSYRMPICVASQANLRDELKNASEEACIFDNNVYVFRGPNMKVATLVIKTKNERELKRTLQDWKKTLNFLDSHQIIAFHFTTIDGKEPKNSEQLFSETFPDIRLNTLLLFGEKSITGVNYQIQNLISTKSRFTPGPVYVIVGLRKFGYECSNEKYSSKKSTGRISEFIGRMFRNKKVL